jgi:hypothetical protein
VVEAFLRERAIQEGCIEKDLKTPFPLMLQATLIPVPFKAKQPQPPSPSPLRRRGGVL